MSSERAPGPRRMLAVFAHPDDEVLCAAGTLALCSAGGGRVELVCATRGELGPIADSALATRETLGRVREGELRRSCSLLGVARVDFLDLPDAGVSWAAQSQGSLGLLVEHMRRLRPDVLVTFGPDGLYGHTDHVAIGELAMQARDRAQDASFPSAARGAMRAPFRIPRAFFPVLTAEHVAQLLAAAERAGRPAQLWSLQPSAFLVEAHAITAEVDVGAVLERKLAALRCHRTQLEPDNVFANLTAALARQFLGREYFRCADGSPGGPLDSP